MDGSCVRVDPQFVDFHNVKVGQVYKTTVTVTNVGKTSKKIIIEKPALKVRYTTEVFLKTALKLKRKKITQL